MAIVHIESVKDFEKEIEKSEGFVILDFWAPWCGPCKMLGPIFEAVSEDYDNVKFAKLNVDEVSEVAQRFNIMSIPTMIVFKDGEVFDQTMGAMAKEQLKDFVDNCLDEA